MPRLLLLLPNTTYRTADFLAAAGKLGVDVTVATDEPSAVEGLNPDGLVSLDFRDPEGAARRAGEIARGRPFDAVVGVDDDSAVAAAAVARALGLKQNSLPASAAARNKAQMRARLALARVPVAPFRLYRRSETDRAKAAAETEYPCVLKPTFLAASRGVIRADDPEAFVAAWDRIGLILDSPDVASRGGEAAGEILVEGFVAGREVALEGMLDGGRLTVLALFDKPDPLDGPFFEETIYVTPSRLPGEVQTAIAAVVSRAASALGLTEGPVHAELRVNESGPVVIEVAARSIGGLCSRTLTFGTGMSLEEVILRHALGIPADAPRESGAAAVLMVPIPRGGVFERMDGLEEARRVPGIVETTITMRPGQRLVPLPEGSRYLGFLFSRADSPAEAERALREAHAKLTVVYLPGE
jgi:biotin carboxylase